MEILVANLRRYKKRIPPFTNDHGIALRKLRSQTPVLVKFCGRPATAHAGGRCKTGVLGCSNQLPDMQLIYGWVTPVILFVLTLAR